MLAAYRASMSGMRAQQLNLDVIANNIANVQTTGFRQSRVNFQDLIYQQSSLIGGFNQNTTQTAPQSVLLGAGVRTGVTEKIFSQGNIVQDGNPEHLAIIGDGYFLVQMPDGSAAYTRAGNFQVSQDGRLVTPTGGYLQPTIAIPPDAHDVAVAANGLVYARMGDTLQTVQIGTIQLARFQNPQGLIATGDNLFRATPESGPATMNYPTQGGAGRILGGALEASNVNMADQMAALIVAERSYQFNIKSLQTIDQMLSEANGLGR